MEILIGIGVNLLLQALRDTKAVRKAAPALRKVYLALHASRAQFLKPGDELMLNGGQSEAK